MPPDDAEAFVDALIYLYEHPELAASIALKARKKVERFDWGVVKKEWVALLEGLVVSVENQLTMNNEQ